MNAGGCRVGTGYSSLNTDSGAIYAVRPVSLDSLDKCRDWLVHRARSEMEESKTSRIRVALTLHSRQASRGYRPREVMDDAVLLEAGQTTC